MTRMTRWKCDARTRRTIRVGLLLAMWVIHAVTAAASERRLAIREYRSRMAAGWLGQMAGVTWGAPTEFKWKDAIIPADRVPAWSPAKLVGGFDQDDMYVEMTFLRTLELHGLEVSIRRAGIDFANSEYPLWCANKAGRNNLRRGIAPPDSGHPAFNRCPNDIDYQIEADYSGLIAPGLPQAAVDFGEKFGRLMNYGDGVYAGQFIGAMYAAAFFESDRERVVESALRAIPSESHYAEMVRDVLAWYRAEPRDWEATWRKCQKKWREDPAYQKGSNGGIDCRINGAYVLIGLLYGGGDMTNTIVIAMRCGQDSDCNPSSAAGVLGTMLGIERLPSEWRTALPRDRRFSYTAYTWDDLLRVCEQLARQVILRYGGRVEQQGTESEVWVIPDAALRPSKLVRSWEPEPPLGVRFDPIELAEIRWPPEDDVVGAVKKFFPGWNVDRCGRDMEPGFRHQWGGRANVVVTHPWDRTTPCVLWRSVRVPSSGARLRIEVANDPRGDFELIVKVDGNVVTQRVVNVSDASAVRWFTQEVDLSPWAGKECRIELENRANGWSWEAAYWSKVECLPQ